MTTEPIKESLTTPASEETPTADSYVADDSIASESGKVNSSGRSGSSFGVSPGVALEVMRRLSQAGTVPAAALLRAATGFIAGTVNGDTEERRENNQARNAEQLFNVLGAMRGGAAKIGKALSVFEPAVPQHLIGPYVMRSLNSRSNSHLSRIKPFKAHLSGSLLVYR